MSVDSPTSEEIFEEIDDLRERGIEFLVAHRQEDKQEHEFSARELAPILQITDTSVYAHMANLVRSGEWITRMAFDKTVHKTIRVWSLKILDDPIA